MHRKQLKGSPTSGEPVFLVVGKLRRPHGLRGNMLMESITDFPERLRPEEIVYIGNTYLPFRILNCKQHGRALLISFHDYTSVDDVGHLRNQMVYVKTDDRPPLPEGEYYFHQLLGLRVVSAENQVIGTLVQILETGANDVYIVRSDSGEEVLLPAIKNVIREIDIDRGEILVNLLPGLISD
ncbi:ribosome maturation factor RimM [Chloroflexota bacterium]